MVVGHRPGIRAMAVCSVNVGRKFSRQRKTKLTYMATEQADPPSLPASPSMSSAALKDSEAKSAPRCSY